MGKRADELIERLGLEEHPEGGYFREIFRSDLEVETKEAEARRRNALTSIYFLLRGEQISRWHVVASDEAWHFYEGDPLELHVFDPLTNSVTEHLLGTRVAAGQVPVAIVPAGCWQAARPRGDYSLVGCSVGPGFDFEDFQFVSDLEETSQRFEEVRDLARLRQLL